MSRTGALPLRLLIIIPTTLLFLIAAMLIGGISLHNSLDTGRAFGQQIAQERSERLENQIKLLTQRLPAILELNAQGIRSGRLDIQQPVNMAPWLYTQIQQSEHMTFISVALPDGRYINGARAPASNGQTNIASNFLDGELTLASYAPNPNGSIGHRTSALTAYDPRQRPYMQAALREPGQLAWGSIHRYVGLPDFGISMSLAVTDAQGKVIAVCGVDMALAEISEFIAHIPLGNAGIAYLADAEGKLIATSSTAIPFVDPDTPSVRLNLASHPSALLREVSQHNIQPFSHILDVQGQRYLANIRRIDLGHGLHWQLGVLLPEQEFVGKTMKTTRQALGLMLMILVLLALCGALLGGLIARPIENISQLANSRALNALQQDSFKNSPIREVRSLSASMAHLSDKLAESIDELENRVIRRTRELQAANDKLQQLSTQDSLTDIANRRAFDQHFNQQWLMAKREQQPLSLMLIDIDHFKAFNDKYGHPAGDQALIQVAEQLAAQLHRSTDLVARYGGEEFAVVLPNTSLEAAAPLAEQMCKAIASQPAMIDDKPYFLTISVGVSSMIPGHRQSPKALLQRADQRLYQAKSNGRNRVSMDE
ncbi:sensor domain-containing diguanylate cyclase [Bowmanella pacifica]|uniref:diguanylate cyclase n=1 Tax=Bowmanella pacifica TaxID=502051 RepID=A0A917Z640_9ALTE|nr:sensor domain-containing diguanylate cyclase [Bowmanella pacifica]GGO75003.1 hypothetical protein GCM10010982_39160 [Bowmanella pacifica]